MSTEDSPLNTSEVHKCLNRPDLYQFFGGDREMMMVAALAAVAAIFVGMTIPSVISGIVLWSAAVVVLRKLAKADPLMRHIYLRYRQYQKFYPAQSTPFAITRKVKMHRLNDPIEERIL